MVSTEEHQLPLRGAHHMGGWSPELTVCDPGFVLSCLVSEATPVFGELTINQFIEHF